MQKWIFRRFEIVGELRNQVAESFHMLGAASSAALCAPDAAVSNRPSDCAINPLYH